MAMMTGNHPVRERQTRFGEATVSGRHRCVGGEEKRPAVAIGGGPAAGGAAAGGARGLFDDPARAATVGMAAGGEDGGQTDRSQPCPMSTIGLTSVTSKVARALIMDAASSPMTIASCLM